MTTLLSSAATQRDAELRRAAVEAERERLRPFLTHDPACAFVKDLDTVADPRMAPRGQCDCGFDDWLALLAPETPKEKK